MAPGTIYFILIRINNWK